MTGMEVSRRDFGWGLAGASAMLWAIAPTRAIRAGSSPLLTAGAVRLILAGNDVSGQSAVIEDKMIAETTALPGGRSTVIWATDGPYPTLDYSAARPSVALPAHPGAAVFRIDRLPAAEGAVGHAPRPQRARPTSLMGYQVVIEGAMSFQTDQR